MASGAGFRRVLSPYDLPTYQKRLRHLRCLAVRNLFSKSYCGKDIHKMQTYFTLHKDDKAQAFYKSETITGSVNPTWRSFDISRYEKDIDTKARFLVVRVWVGHETKFNLLIHLQVNITGLYFFAEKLQQDSVKYAPNSVIFGMFDKYFVSVESKKESRGHKPQTPDHQVSEVPSEIGSPSYVLRVDQAGIRNSYSTNSISRIHTILRATTQTQGRVDQLHNSIEDRLVMSHEKSEKLCEREGLLMKVGQLRSELMWKTSKLQTEKDFFDKLKTRNMQRNKMLKEQRTTLENSSRSLVGEKKSYVQTREMYVKENAQLLIRRKQLIGEMSGCIYSITENSKKQLCICGVRLPNSEDFHGQDEVMVAVGLGYTCHLTMMISHILDLPLRYPMDSCGSRAMIRDHIHTKLADKDRDFPLFSKGREKFQFNYGVFLLNKNISQIRFYCGLGTTDLRMTLPNLRTLLELRLGVKIEFPLPRSLTPTSGTGNSISSSLAKESTQSLAGSSSTSSLARKEELIAAQPDVNLLEAYDSFESRDKNSSNTNVESYSKPVLNRKPTEDKSDESEDLFSGNDDDFFSIPRPASKNLGDSGAIPDNSPLNDFDKGVNSDLGDNDILILGPDSHLNDMEAVKATLKIHFDNSEENSSRSTSYDEADTSSGEDHPRKVKHLPPSQLTDHHLSINNASETHSESDKVISNSLPSPESNDNQQELSPLTSFKTSAFRSNQKARDISRENSIDKDYSKPTEVVS